MTPNDQNIQAYVGRYRLFFVHSIDLGFLLAGDEDKAQLHEKRANDTFFNELCDTFDRSVTAGSYEGPKVETESLIGRAGDAVRRGGKNIWSDLFLLKYAPLLFECSRSLQLNSTISHIPGTQVPLQDIIDADTKVLRFRRSELRVFREGTLAISYEYEQDQTNEFISIDDLIARLKWLSSLTTDGFVRGVKEILGDWRHNHHVFQNLELVLKSPTEKGIDELIRTSSVRHKILVVENVYSSRENAIPIDVLEQRHLLLGLLNQAVWYSKYRESYIDSVFEKNVGYRADEIYVTDKDDSLIVLADYWDPNKPLRFYLYDLKLACELQIAKLAYLQYTLSHMQSDPVLMRTLTDLSGDDAVQTILQANTISMFAEESLQINALVIHGFTRAFLVQLIQEKGLFEYVGAIERRIELLHRAVSLKSSVDIGREGVGVDRLSMTWGRRGYWIAVVALLINMVLTLVSLILQIQAGNSVGPLIPTPTLIP